MFKPHLFNATPEHRQVYGLYERIYTLVDVAAAWLFIVGSIMFFSATWERTGTWFFLIGSICFAARPTVRLLRELHLSRLPLPENDPN
ncbi:MAG: YrhK family protein [Pseudomonadota bacterium]